MIRFKLWSGWELLSVPRRLERRIISSWLKLIPGDKVCDVGCGNEGFSRMLASQGATVFGVDLRFDALQVGATWNLYGQGVQFVHIHADAERTPFPADGFDLEMNNFPLDFEYSRRN